MVATMAHTSTALSAVRMSPIRVRGVATTASAAAAATASSTGATASHASLTPRTVSTVCSSAPVRQRSTSSATPCSPIRGNVSVPAVMRITDGIASAIVSAGIRR